MEITKITDNITLSKNMVIPLINTINDLLIVDMIGNLSVIYENVYLCNTFYDNPLDNVFYIVCVNKIKDDNNFTLNLNYFFNINFNKSLIYDMILSVYNSYNFYE